VIRPSIDVPIANFVDDGPEHLTPGTNKKQSGNPSELSSRCQTLAELFVDQEQCRAADTEGYKPSTKDPVVLSVGGEFVLAVTH
jgi:hypothetical protein